ncbi:MAG: succinate dehydrogenase assembly factor 2 [Burkholderiaceae bacterium]|nr:succinate dehydrogenase assembly factor 2 [Burkholderiaceae bacterium]
MENELIGERELSKLRWRCRRGLLENDLFIERFFNKYAATLTVKQAQGLNVLMDLSDNDLLDLNLARKSLDDMIAGSPNLDCLEAREVLAMLRSQD